MAEKVTDPTFGVFINDLETVEKIRNGDSAVCKLCGEGVYMIFSYFNHAPICKCSHCGVPVYSDQDLFGK